MIGFRPRLTDKYMALIVQKYGGTSVGSTERIAQVAERVAGYLARGHQVAVVVSAMSGETNRLVAMGHELGGPAASRREMDVLTSSGEQVTYSAAEYCATSTGHSG
jgi:aspartate kinase